MSSGSNKSLATTCLFLSMLVPHICVAANKCQQLFQGSQKVINQPLYSSEVLDPVWMYQAFSDTVRFIEVTKEVAQEIKNQVLGHIHEAAQYAKTGDLNKAMEALLKSAKPLERAGFFLYRLDNRPFEIAPLSHENVTEILSALKYEIESYKNPEINYIGTIHVPVYKFGLSYYRFGELKYKEMTFAEQKISEKIVTELNFLILAEELIHAAQILSAYSREGAFLSQFFLNSIENQMRLYNFREKKGTYIPLVTVFLEADVYAFMLEQFGGAVVPLALFENHPSREVVGRSYLRNP